MSMPGPKAWPFIHLDDLTKIEE